MKYNININQLVLSKTKLDLKDGAILDYLINFCSCDDKTIKQLTISENGINYKYTWINFNHLIAEMPLLGIKSKGSLSQRIAKIEKTGFIKTYLAPDRSMYVRLMPKIKELYFQTTTTEIGQGGVHKNEQGVFTKMNSTNIISFKHNIINNIRKKFPKKNKEIDNLLEEIKKELKIEKFADTPKWVRRYAFLCLRDYGKETTINAVKWMKENWKNKPLKTKTIYYGIPYFLNRTKKPFYGEYPMKFRGGKWWVQVGGELKEYTGSEKDITWK